jgi:hypothetical protein
MSSESDVETYEECVRRREEALRPRLTGEFLELLVRTARTVGWNADFAAVAEFVEEVYRVAGRPVPLDELDDPYCWHLMERMRCAEARGIPTCRPDDCPFIEDCQYEATATGSTPRRPGNSGPGQVPPAV